MCEWRTEQVRLKTQLVETDAMRDWSCPPDADTPTGLRLVGGVDISFVKGDAETACACLVVLSFPKLEVLHRACEVVALTKPYIPGFLAFRESCFLEGLLAKLKREQPELMPHSRFVGDGRNNATPSLLQCQQINARAAA